MGKHSRKLPNDERTDRANFLLLENEFQAWKYNFFSYFASYSVSKSIGSMPPSPFTCFIKGLAMLQYLLFIFAKNGLHTGLAQREFYFNFLNIGGVATCGPAFSQNYRWRFSWFWNFLTGFPLALVFLHVFVKNCSGIVGLALRRTDERSKWSTDCDQK